MVNLTILNTQKESYYFYMTANPEIYQKEMEYDEIMEQIFPDDDYIEAEHARVNGKPVVLCEGNNECDMDNRSPNILTFTTNMGERQYGFEIHIN